MTASLQGFWKDHLQGRPYHISALYVIDLERFRQVLTDSRSRACGWQLAGRQLADSWQTALAGAG